MTAPRFLACDFGAESGRVILGEMADGHLKLEEVHRFANRPVRMLGRLHWDLPGLFSGMKEGFSKAVQAGGTEFSGIGVDTWGVDFGLLDRSGALAGLPVTYRDFRTDGMMEAAFDCVPRERIYQITGIQFLQLNTLYQLLSLVREGAPVLENARHLLFMPDLFNYLLTGVRGSEYSIASTSQLMDAGTCRWSEELFDRLQLPIGIMPGIALPGSVVGPLLTEIREDTGLGDVPVISPGGHDTACAVAAVPAQGRDWGYLSSGTWSLLGVEVDHPIISEKSLEGNFTNEGGVEGRVRFLKNNMGLWLLERCRRAWEAEGERHSYEDLVELAHRARPFGSVIDPDDPAFLNPPDMPAAIVDYCRRSGQPKPQTRGEFVRTVFESLALKYRFIIDQLNSMRGSPIAVLHIVGGGSRNRLLNQFTANASGVEVLAGPVEATASGNILSQAIACGLITGLAEARQTVRRSFQLESFEPKETDAWQEAYARRRHLYH